MGAPELLVLLSESPEYNQKVKLAVLLAPIVIWKHKLQPIMKMYNHLRKFIHKMVTEQNYYEWLPQSSFAGEFAKNHCKNNMYPELSLCSNLLRIVADITTFNTSAIPTIFAHFPAGISYQSVEHYWQNIDTREFQAYNYGTRINQNLYFSSNPPVYDLSQVTAPVALFFGHKDFFATSKDVEILRQRLPNVVLFKEVLYKKFNHLDFLWSQYVKTLLYDDVISLANEYALLNTFQVNKVLPQSPLAAAFGAKFCKDGDALQNLCTSLISTIGLDPLRLNRTAIPNILAHFPAGTSVITVYSYNQNYKMKKFQAYDYGVKDNMRKYGQKTPPVYDLSKVTAPVSIWYAKNDDIVNYKDVQYLKKQLPNVATYEEVQNENFNHFDFLWSYDAKELVYDFMIIDIDLRNTLSRLKI
ncbi:gastric triacylglycerol lipase-like [Copidosoma floridanum]|uniref:gastric triacylglycerol lipase-like n=1 Tax=Copidosoma floridanum TaxID=29053 RepID=UPI000C6F9D6E|nr:gastric triacylglycerol lipase-like [Copidosoma floridanum]